eukprot:7396355-Pyramimonas_sp.AAC.1
MVPQTETPRLAGSGSRAATGQGRCLLAASTSAKTLARARKTEINKKAESEMPKSSLRQNGYGHPDEA